MKPLLLTGPPASGKSTTARALAETEDLAAVIDVDDIRQLIVAGHAAPWQGAAGAEQHRIGVENTCDLARRFLDSGVAVVIADVVSPATAEVYRGRLPDVLIVGFRISFGEATRRAATRAVQLTDSEFRMLHGDQPTQLALADHVIEVDAMDVAAQVAAVRRLW